MDQVARPGFDSSKLVEAPEATSSGVSWSACIAGAFATAALGFEVRTISIDARQALAPPQQPRWPECRHSLPVETSWLLLLLKPTSSCRQYGAPNERLENRQFVCILGQRSSARDCRLRGGSGNRFLYWLSRQYGFRGFGAGPHRRRPTHGKK